MLPEDTREWGHMASLAGTITIYLGGDFPRIYCGTSQSKLIGCIWPIEFNSICRLLRFAIILVFKKFEWKISKYRLLNN